MTIRELYEIIESRRNSDESTSYTRQLFDRGLDRIIQKVGEESVEVVIAAKNNENDKFIKITDIERRLQERHDNDNKLIK